MPKGIYQPPIKKNAAHKIASTKGLGSAIINFGFDDSSSEEVLTPRKVLEKAKMSKTIKKQQSGAKQPVPSSSKIPPLNIEGLPKVKFQALAVKSGGFYDLNKQIEAQKTTWVMFSDILKFLDNPIS